MKSSKLIIVILVLQALTLAGQWLGQPTLVAPAQAQIVDSGAQRNQMIDQLKSVNDKLDKLIGLLENGTLQVKVTGADEKDAHRPSR